MQPKCEQTAEHVCTLPLLSRDTATLDDPRGITAPIPRLISSTVLTSPGVSQRAYSPSTLEFCRANVSVAGSVFRAGSYRVTHGLSRPIIKSRRRIPAIVPCVMPAPESPVAMYTFESSLGLRPMNATSSIDSITCPDHLNAISLSSGKCFRPQVASRANRPSIPSACPVLWSSPPIINRSCDLPFGGTR